MGMIGYFAEIDSEKINQLLESTEKPLMDNIHDTLSGLRRLDIDKRWDFLHFGLTGTSAFDPAKNDPLSRAVLGEHSLEDGIDGFLGLTWNQAVSYTHLDVYKRQTHYYSICNKVRSPAALLSISCHSCSGSEPRTMPAPAYNRTTLPLIFAERRETQNSLCCNER